MEIIKLDPNQKGKASQVLSAAFFDYPMFTFYFPDPKKRSRNLGWYLGNVLNCALRYGDVYTTPEISGVAFTLPPGHTQMTLWEYIQNGFVRTPLVLGFHNYIRSMECESFVQKTHQMLTSDQPHYYLWGIAVDPFYKGKGIGTALMKSVISKADADKKPIYLETHDEKNVIYYQNMGFELIHTDSIPKYELPIWCMLRKANWIKLGAL